MAEAMTADRTVRLQRVNLPAASPLVNPDSAHHRPGREADGAADHSPCCNSATSLAIFTAIRPRPSTCRAAAPGPMPVGRSAEALDAGPVASGAGSSPANPASAPPQAVRCWGVSRARIKPGEAVPPRQGGPRCRPGGERRRDQAGRARRCRHGGRRQHQAGRAWLGAGDVPCPWTCPAASCPGRPMG
jgi:hypothetical protein